MVLRLKTEVEGMTRLRRKLEKFDDDIKAPIRQAVAQSALKVESDAKRLIQQGARSGRIYKRGQKTHQASAPGEPPKTDTGTLVSNIFSVFPLQDKGLVAVVGTNLEYGKHLEFGTIAMRGSRPWLRPAFKKNAEKIIELIRKRVRAAIKKQAARRAGGA